MTNPHTLDPAAFRLAYPAFASTTQFTDPFLQTTFVSATAFIDASDNWGISGQTLQTALDLMTAHLLWSQYLLSIGQSIVGVVSGASIDKVSVSIQPPQNMTGWQTWLSTTPYGLQLWALLSMAGGVGDYIGGSYERAAFRKVGGYFE